MRRSITPDQLYYPPEPVDLIDDKESIASIEIKHEIKNNTLSKRNTGYILLLILLIPIVIFIFKKLYCPVCKQE